LPENETKFKVKTKPKATLLFFFGGGGRERRREE
jgi:hypothetical protein